MSERVLQPGFDGWIYFDMANCYQFAIGLRVDLLKKLMPGELSGNTIEDGHEYSDDELIRFVSEDLLKLGYVLEECERDVMLSEGQWEICILNCPQGSYDYDFHFIARFSTGGTWFQKYAEVPFAESVYSSESGDYDFHYHRVGYYKIRRVEE